MMFLFIALVPPRGPPGMAPPPRMNPRLPPPGFRPPGPGGPGGPGPGPGGSGPRVPLSEEEFYREKQRLLKAQDRGCVFEISNAHLHVYESGCI